MNKFEKLIEYIINDEDQKARELFHSIVVEKSRDIYESIMDEEHVHGAAVDDLANELQDEEAMGEGEGEEFNLGGDVDDDGELDGELPAGDDLSNEFGEPEADEHQEIEDKVMDIDAKLDELLSKFDTIMGNDGDLDGELDGEEDKFSEPEEVGSEVDSEEQIAEASGSGNPFAKGSGKSGSAQSGKSGSAQSGKSGSGKMESRKSTTELMREYVDKIQDMNLTGASEGDAVGAAGKKSPINAKSIEGPGADFGGQTASPKGGVQNQDGTSPTKASNEYNKGQSEIKSGNLNVPGGDAGKKGFKSKEGEYSTEKGAEGQTTSGKVPVATKSVQAQNTGKK